MTTIGTAEDWFLTIWFVGLFTVGGIVQIVLAVRGLREGVITFSKGRHGRGHLGPYARSNDPANFWIAVIWFLVFGTAFLLIGVVNLIRPLFG